MRATPPTAQAMLMSTAPSNSKSSSRSLRSFTAGLLVLALHALGLLEPPTGSRTDFGVCDAVGLPPLHLEDQATYSVQSGSRPAPVIYGFHPPTVAMPPPPSIPSTSRVSARENSRDQRHGPDATSWGGRVTNSAWTSRAFPPMEAKTWAT